jgi:uncharacterized phage protein gp47/JayE
MAGLPTSFTPQTLQQFQQLIASQYSQQAAKTANTDSKSTLAAIFNAVAALAVQQQLNISQAFALSRLATSSGPDVDSFCQPFGVTRLPQEASSGTVVFSTPSPVSGKVTIPVGTIVSTPSGLQFVVIADNSQPGYNASDGGYDIFTGQSSVSATVQCLTPGSIGNVQANQITQLYGGPGAQPIVGVNAVTNPAAFTNGRDAETDAELKNRFTQQMMSGGGGTNPAIAAAILGVQPGLTYSIGDQINPDGSAHSGFFTVVVNVAGSGTAPQSSLINSVNNAVANARAVGIAWTVVAPTLVPVNVTATLHLASGAISANVIAAATTAMQNFINGIGLNPNGSPTTCTFAQTIATLLGVSGVANVTGLQLNGGTADITAAFANQLVAGTMNFTTQ